MSTRDQSLPENAVETFGLTKLYKASGKSDPVQALTDVSLAVPRGSIFGLLGPNGAGKSTLINILAGLVIKTSGTAEIWGQDIAKSPRQARSAIGIVPQEVYFDTFFSPREVMELQAGYYGVPPAERRTMELLEAVDLADKADAYPRSLSGGMKRRLMVAKALAHAPPVVILDEPTAGVDVELRHQLWTYLRELNRRGTTLMLTTHYLEEAEELCDFIAIINHGKVIACEPTPDLVARLDRKALTVSVSQPLDAVPPALVPHGATLESPHHLVFRYRPSASPVAAILASVQEAGLSVSDISTEESDLEDIFLELTSGKEHAVEGESGPPSGGADPQAGEINISRRRPSP